MPRIAVRAIVIKKGMILLSKYQNGDKTWYVTPGGGVKNGETLEEAFARETNEECGVSLPFGEIKFIREIIANRHKKTTLEKNFHQIDINVLSSIDKDIPLLMRIPDKEQVDLIWYPLDKLNEIEFYPVNLIQDFMNQSWSKFYYGDVM